MVPPITASAGTNADTQPVPVTMLIFTTASDIAHLRHAPTATEGGDYIRKGSFPTDATGGGKTLHKDVRTEAVSAADDSCGIRWSFVFSDQRVEGCGAIARSGQHAEALSCLRELTRCMKPHTRFVTGGEEVAPGGERKQLRFLAPSSFETSDFSWAEGALDGAGAAIGAARSTCSPLLCVDVGGVYAAVPPTPPSQDNIMKTVPRVPASSPTKTLHHGAKSTTRGAVQRAGAGGAETLDGGATPVLDSLLYRRFSAAQTTCPFDIRKKAPLTLAAVWVVPLSAAETAGSMQQCWTPLDCFPWLMEVTAAAQALKDSSSSSPRAADPGCWVRPAQYAAHLQLHLPVCRSAVETPVHRKRPRDESLSVSCRVATTDATPAAATVAERRRGVHVAPHTLSASTLQLRVVAIGFLSRSCFLSTWCCADDFDVTNLLLRSGDTGTQHCAADAVSRGLPHHPFYAALESAAESEETHVAAGLGATWREQASASVSAASHLRFPWGGGGCISTAQRGREATAVVYTVPPAADDLFDDAPHHIDGGVSAQRDLQSGVASPAVAALARLPVWPLRVAWDLWTRLGWVPPSRGGFFLVQMGCTGAGPACDVDEPQGGRPRWFTASEWMAFVDRCADGLDDAYVQQVMAALDEETSVGEFELHGLVDEQTEGDEMCASAPTATPAMSAEGVVAQHRLFALRAALLDVEASAEASRTAPGRACAGSMGTSGGGAGSNAPRLCCCRGAATGGAYVGAAAQALAADLAATTPNCTEAHVAAKGECAFASGVDFSLDFVSGVLEAPALLFPFLPPWDATAAVTAPPPPDGTGDVSAAGPLPASVVNARLQQRQEECAPADPTSTEVSLRMGVAAAATEADEDEACCEVVDVAELRWRTTSPSALHSVALTPSARLDTSCCCCCCSRACRRVAARLFEASAVPTASAFTSPRAADEGGVDVLTRWLGTAFEDFLSRNGIQFPAASASTDAHTVSAEAPTDRAEGQGSEYPADASAVKNLLTATIVRCVQQNKTVVRRLMQLVLTYQGSCAADTAASKHNDDAEGAEEVAADKDSGDVTDDAAPQEALRLAEAHRVWCCLTGAREAAPSLAEAPSVHAECARDLAVRQLQAFWTSVATATRQSVSQKVAQRSSTVPQRLQNGVPPPPPREEDACSVAVEAEYAVAAADDRTDAAAPATALLHGGSSGAPAVDAALLPDAAAGTVFSSVTGARFSGDSAVSGRAGNGVHAGDALTTALAALDGPQAMQLYMQHVLRCCCSSSADTSPSHLSSAAAAASITEAGSRGREARVEAVAPHSLSTLLQPHMWVQHALFLLSYGVGGSATVPPPAPQNASPLPSAVTERALQACESASDASCAAVDTPALAAFRLLRGGKVVLDTWIVAARETYAGRWQRARERHTRCARVPPL